MQWPYHVVDRLNLLMPSASVIKLLSNPRIPINALACGSGINQNSRVANQLNNLASGINYYLIILIIIFKIKLLKLVPCYQSVLQSVRQSYSLPFCEALPKGGAVNSSHTHSHPPTGHTYHHLIGRFIIYS